MSKPVEVFSREVLEIVAKELYEIKAYSYLLKAVDILVKLSVCILPNLSIRGEFQVDSRLPFLDLCLSVLLVPCFPLVSLHTY